MVHKEAARHRNLISRIISVAIELYISRRLKLRQTGTNVRIAPQSLTALLFNVFTGAQDDLQVGP